MLLNMHICTTVDIDNEYLVVGAAPLITGPFIFSNENNTWIKKQKNRSR